MENKFKACESFGALSCDINARQDSDEWEQESGRWSKGSGGFDGRHTVVEIGIARVLLPIFTHASEGTEERNKFAFGKWLGLTIEEFQNLSVSLSVTQPLLKDDQYQYSQVPQLTWLRVGRTKAI